MGKVIIIGGGVIGLCSAYYLRRSGWDVTVVDKGDMTDNCSYGNAGMIVPSHFVPLAAPGAIKQGIRWLFNPKGPFQLRPELDSEWLRWTFRFIRSANRRHVERSAISLRDISMFSKSLFEKLHEDLDIGLKQNGIMMLSASKKSHLEERLQAQSALDMGLDVVCLSKEEAIQLQGGLPMNIVGGVHYRCDAHLHPGELMKRLINWLTSEGVRIIRNSEVDQVARFHDKVVGITLNTKEELTADAFVLSAGVWSSKISKQFAFRLSVMPGRGYSFTTGATNMKLPIPVLLSEARVAITPLGNSMRFGGTMELGNREAPINLKRVQGIVESANRYFPGLGMQVPEKPNIWQGFRPCSPDGLPYIGFSSKAPNVVIATGHGMMGISLGPATGALVCEMLSGSRTSVNVELFSPNRFS